MTGLVDGFIQSILFILSESLLSGASAKNEPQMNAEKRRLIASELSQNDSKGKNSFTPL